MAGKFVSIGAQHHNNGSGPLWLIDLNQGREVRAAIRNIGPARVGTYDYPYPLHENYHLVSHCPTWSSTGDNGNLHQPTTDWGLYLVDIHGGQELLYRDPELAALFGMPLRARPAPPRLAEATDFALGGFGEFFVQDVHVHRPSAMQGKGRFLRIVEAHERHIHAGALQVGEDSGFELKTVLGVCPLLALRRWLSGLQGKDFVATTMSTRRNYGIF